MCNNPLNKIAGIQTVNNPQKKKQKKKKNVLHFLFPIILINENLPNPEYTIEPKRDLENIYKKGKRKTIIILELFNFQAAGIEVERTKYVRY